MKPSIGRIVHFVYSSVHYAAIITRVWSDTCVNLFVFDSDHGQLLNSINTSVVLDEDETPHDYTWHWPEKV